MVLGIRFPYFRRLYVGMVLTTLAKRGRYSLAPLEVLNLMQYLVTIQNLSIQPQILVGNEVDLTEKSHIWCFSAE